MPWLHPHLLRRGLEASLLKCDHTELHVVAFKEAGPSDFKVVFRQQGPHVMQLLGRIPCPEQATMGADI